MWHSNAKPIRNVHLTLDNTRLNNQTDNGFTRAKPQSNIIRAYSIIKPVEVKNNKKMCSNGMIQAANGECVQQFVDD